MTGPLKFGIIGTNWITDSWIDSAHATGKWQLSAVYSRTPEAATSFASKYSVTTTYTSIPSLVADPALDAIYIASPNSHHYEHAHAALSAGKHVVLEKPSVSTPEELSTLFDLARSKSVFLLEAWRHLSETNFLALRRAVHERKILGETIYGAALSYASFSSRYHAVTAGERPNIFTLDFSGGSLVDVGVYPIAFAVALWGRPRNQTYSAYITPTGVDGGGPVVLSYDGFAVQINQSKIWTGHGVSEIYGEKGTLSVNATADIEWVRFWDNKSKETKELGGEKAGKNMQEEAEEIGRVILEKDTKIAERMEALSRDVLHVTSDLRKQNGIVFGAEREKK